MPLLKCSVTTCYYNDENKCSRDSIQVEGSHADNPSGTACGSFRLRTKDSATNSCGCEKPKDKLDVDCEARNCKFNEDCKCNARDIGIAGSGACTCGETKCASFDMR